MPQTLPPARLMGVRISPGVFRVRRVTESDVSAPGTLPDARPPAPRRAAALAPLGCPRPSSRTFRIRVRKGAAKNPGSRSRGCAPRGCFWGVSRGNTWGGSGRPARRPKKGWSMEGERARVAGNARGVWDRGRAEKCVRSRRVVAVVLGVGVTQCRERGEAGEQASDLVEALTGSVSRCASSRGAF